MSDTPKPKPEDFGYEPRSPLNDTDHGWMIEGGEDAYNAAMEKWQSEQLTPKTDTP